MQAAAESMPGNDCFIDFVVGGLVGLGGIANSRMDPYGFWQLKWQKVKTVRTAKASVGRTIWRGRHNRLKAASGRFDSQTVPTNQDKSSNSYPPKRPERFGNTGDNCDATAETLEFNLRKHQVDVCRPTTEC